MTASPPLTHAPQEHPILGGTLSHAALSVAKSLPGILHSLQSFGMTSCFRRQTLKGHGWLNDVEQPAVTGCTDIDLNFSPSIHLLPIRRPGLTVGEPADVNAAWLRFPSFKLERLSQQYIRPDENTCRYENAAGRFVAELKVDLSGFGIDDPCIWQAQACSE